MTAALTPFVADANWCGIFPDMPAEEYHLRALGIASSGALKLALRSLAHYRHWAQTRFDVRNKHLDFGKAYHAFVLEPQHFFRDYVVAPVGAPKRPDERSRNAKNPQFKTMEAMAFWDDFDRRHAGKAIVSAADYQKIQDMRAALDDEDMIGELPSAILAEGEREVSLRWIDADTGLPCRARFDHLHRAMRYGMDLKSCADGTEDGFTRAMVRHAYHLSQAHYLAGAHALEHPLKGYFFLSQETFPPYVATVNEIDSTFEELGFSLWKTSMKRLAQGVATGRWPGYATSPTGIRRLSPPAYAFYSDPEETK